MPDIWPVKNVGMTVMPAASAVSSTVPRSASARSLTARARAESPPRTRRCGRPAGRARQSRQTQSPPRRGRSPSTSTSPSCAASSSPPAQSRCSAPPAYRLLLPLPGYHPAGHTLYGSRPASPVRPLARRGARQSKGRLGLARNHPPRSAHEVAPSGPGTKIAGRLWKRCWAPAACRSWSAPAPFPRAGTILTV